MSDLRSRLSRSLVAASLLAGAAMATAMPSAAEAAATAVTPSRILDTRSGLGGFSGRLDPGEVLTLRVPSASAASATAVAFNLTADSALGVGYVSAWPCDESRPTASVVNFTPAHSVPNMVMLALPDDGICMASSAPVHLIADLVGHFTGTDEFAGSAPNRLLDTRQGTGMPMRAGETRRIAVAGTPGIGDSAGAAALNFTVDRPSADGYVTVYPCGSRPEVSTVNFRADETVANTTMMGLDDDGDVCAFTSVATHLIVDSYGSSTGTAGLRPNAPARVLDSRSGNGWQGGRVGNGETVELRVAGRGNVPNDADAALLTITADDGRSDGYVTIWPCDQAPSTTSVVNLWPGVVRSNLSLIKLSATDGEVCLRPTIYDGSSINLIADAVGFVPGDRDRQPPPPPPPPTTPPPPPPSTGEELVPVGAALASEAECSARVQPTGEVRPQNAVANSTRGTQPNGRFARVTGNFTGTTDEIIQWAACKWGIPADWARAQVAKESWWEQDAVGDTRNNDGCTSHGLGQVRRCYHDEAFVDQNAVRSTAYNVDYTYAVWRNCFEGEYTWLERGYAAGDPWGCMGLWFEGDWDTVPGNRYIADVQEYLAERVWETSGFRNS